jgi:hypothetical protein
MPREPFLYQLGDDRHMVRWNWAGQLPGARGNGQTKLAK